MPEEEYIESKSHETNLLLLELPGSGDEQWRGKNPNDYGAQYHTQGQDLGQKVFFREGPPQVWTIAGPQGFGAINDTGPNSISNNVRTGKDIILNFCESNENKTSLDVPLIMIKSHSRNAVAGTHIANYAKTLRVKVEAVFFDPVPGPKEPAENLKTDVSGLDESMLVYSIDPQWNILDRCFTPQTVTSAKRLIISCKDHAVGIDSGVIYDGELFKGYSLNGLGEGLYISEDLDEGLVIKGKVRGKEPENIRKITSNDETVNILKNLNERINKANKLIKIPNKDDLLVTRLEVIRNVIDIFARNAIDTFSLV